MAREMGILMSPPMIAAGLDKNKTQTRRAMKPQPDMMFNNGDWYPDRYNKSRDWCFWGKKGTEVHNKCGLPLFRSRYEVGDDLYWKETHYKYGQWRVYETKDHKIEREFRVNHDFGVWFPDNLPKHLKMEGAIKTGYGDLGWYKRSSLFMFKKDARIWSNVLRVEVQQLKDITEEDAMAEGMSEKAATYLGYSLANHHSDDGTYYRHIYKYLWGHLNGDWKPELWVWKYTMTEPEVK